MSRPSLAPPVDEEELLAWTRTLSNRGRWGPEDELGTLNYITSATRRAAAALVRDGDVVSCARPISTAPSPDDSFGRTPVRFMLSTGEGLDDEHRVRPPGTEKARGAGAMEYVGFVFHGHTITHLDALSHVFWDGRLYNGYPGASVSARYGATRLAVTVASSGIVSRGVLADIPRLRGHEWLRAGEPVLPAELEMAEERARVRVGEGDMLLVRTGRTLARAANPTGTVVVPGWHPTCLPWLHERRVALIGCDTTQDVTPSGSVAVPLPMSHIAIPTMGLWMLDNCDLEALGAACSQKQRWEFQLVLAPLPIEGATGSPVNPLASF